ncbi:MAG: SDR family NAD(P)-dependent oxidoreductase [Pseudomonadota bacterium]
MSKPVCLITGVGDSTGAALARRFTAGGYRVAMIARNGERLHALERQIEGSQAFVCDVADLEALAATVAKVRAAMEPPSILIHNAVAHTFDGFLDADPHDLERNFRVNTTALLHLARNLAPAMIEAGHGAIMVTGNTASHRGVPNYAVFAPTKAAQRILAESLARELGPKGIHVGYVTVDAAIDVSWLGPDSERPRWLIPPDDWPWPREDFFAQPEAIAEEVFHLAHQHRSTWAFDLVIRPFAERW